MSLTSILKEKGREDLKQWFKDNFPNPGIEKDIDIKVLPKQEGSGYARLVGTALDYLIRFKLEYLNKEYCKEQSPNDWVAMIGITELADKILTDSGESLKDGLNSIKDEHIKNVITSLKTHFGKAIEDYKCFINDGEITASLIASVIYLSKLDIVHRAKIAMDNITTPDPIMMRELMELFNIVPWKQFIAKKNCLVNPTFGEGSVLVGGADADLIVDSKLIDIKSNKELKLKRSDLNQIIGYHLLSIIGQIKGNENVKINNIGIYFARFGYLWTPQEDYGYNKYDFIKLSKEFRKFVNYQP